MDEMGTAWDLGKILGMIDVVTEAKTAGERATLLAAVRNQVWETMLNLLRAND